LDNQGKKPRNFTRILFVEKKALPTTFLPAVKTLTKNISFVFLLVQVFFLQKKKCLVKVFAEQNLSLKKKA